MNIIKLLSLSLIAAGLFASCSKDDDNPPEEPIDPAFVKKAEDLKTAVQTKKWRISAYRSDTPIDYDKTDSETKAETDLWSYASPWLKDDDNVIDAGFTKVTITQNAVKMPNLPDPALERNISIGADKEGPYFNFLTHEYTPLRYNIESISADSFVVSAKRDGDVVKTTFSVMAQ